MVPIELAVSMSAAARCPRAMLLIWMFYLAWKAKTRGEDTFVLANCDLERMGVSREVKREVLLDLETAGLIRVERQCPRAPRIQILGAGWCAGGNL